VLTAPSVISKVLAPRFNVAPVAATDVLPMLIVVVLPGWTARVPTVTAMGVFPSEPPEIF